MSAVVWGNPFTSALIEGRQAAKAKGVKFGRKQSIDREQFASLVASGAGATETSKVMKIGRSTVYKLLKEA